MRIAGILHAAQRGAEEWCATATKNRKKGRNKNDGRGKGTGFQVRRAARLQESAG